MEDPSLNVKMIATLKVMISSLELITQELISLTQKDIESMPQEDWIRVKVSMENLIDMKEVLARLLRKNSIPWNNTQSL